MSSVPSGLEPFLVSDLLQNYNAKRILYLIPEEKNLNSYKKIFDVLNEKYNTLTFPSWDCMPYDKISPSNNILNDRLSVLVNSSRCSDSKILFITSVESIIQKLPPINKLKQNYKSISVGMELSFKELSMILVKLGYKHVSTVLEPNEYTTRGGIIDIWPVGVMYPLRLDYFGDVIDSMKIFNPITQITEKNLNSIVVYSFIESPVDPKIIAQFKYSYRKRYGPAGNTDDFFQTLSIGERVQGMEHFVPLYYKNLDTILDYFSVDSIVYNYKTLTAIKERLKEIDEAYQSKLIISTNELKENKPLEPSELYLSYKEIKNLFNKGNEIILNKLTVDRTEKDINFYGKPITPFNIKKDLASNIHEHITKEIKLSREKKQKLILTADGSDAEKNIISLLENFSIFNYRRVKNFKFNIVNDIEFIDILIIPLLEGFETPKLKIITKNEIFKTQRSIKSRDIKKKSLVTLIDLTLGDVVVHEEHGVGKYLGLETIKISTAPHDCVKIEYKEGSILYLPVENIDLLSKYGYSDYNIELDRLGKNNWQKRKQNVKKRIKELASSLINSAAKRKLSKAPKIIFNRDLMDSFSNGFPYEETDDQLSTLDEIFKDLESGYPMDRLICGDVGFGKTEIALRTAFAVAYSGYQVALIAPTTLLTQQHFNNFLNRFTNFSIKIEMISRMISNERKTKILDKLYKNEIQILIGTHSLLSNDIKFSNLGLVIIDEEQNFGVSQKEKIKNYRNNIHLLTLSATPIPRTFYMSLMGVKQLSLIKTPPVDRLAVRTIITTFKKNIIREAILREKSRGGQIFCVVPRIKDINKVTKLIKDYFPTIRLSVAHGRLSTDNLDNVMYNFYNKNLDMLICTSIIQSGLDVPSANTLIVYKSDMFGLAQLHQLRGRIGRSNIKAYAYFTLSYNKQLSNNAERRIQAIQAMDTLGSGFNLSSYDLDIRGAGNLLGSEQSGQISEVGIELYQKLLKRAVDDIIKGSRAKTEEHSVQINISLPVLIPDSYVQDLSLRLSLYRRLGTLSNKDEIEEFSYEMINRFGILPEEFNNLLLIIEIKLLCRRIYLERIDIGKKAYKLLFIKDYNAYPENFINWITSHENKVSFNSDFSLIMILRT